MCIDCCCSSCCRTLCRTRIRLNISTSSHQRHHPADSCLLMKFFVSSLMSLSFARVSCPTSQFWKLITLIPRSKQRCDHHETPQQRSRSVCFSFVFCTCFLPEVSDLEADHSQSHGVSSAVTMMNPATMVQKCLFLVTLSFDFAFSSLVPSVENGRSCGHVHPC